jgi:ABC-2 type transport system ATP-binding protein
MTASLTNSTELAVALPTLLPAVGAAVVIREVSKKFGKDIALRGLNLQVPEGSVYVLVGPNGAGKSTTLKLLLDLVRPDSGSVEVFGKSPGVDGAWVRSHIGYIPERTEWGYGWMRVGRMLEHHAFYYPGWDRDYAARLVRLFGLKLDRRLGKLSKGLARRVHLTMALAHRPRLLVLDEPTDGLDPLMLDETLGLLMEHVAETPTTVLLSTHQIHEVDRMVDYVGVMREGNLMLQCPRDVLHLMLRRYRCEVPDGWKAVPELRSAVLRVGSFGREVQLSIWGEESEIVERLRGAGAVIRDVAPLTLSDATIALLARKDRP